MNGKWYHRGFDLAFPWRLMMMLSIFSCAHLYNLNVCSISLPIFCRGYLFCYWIFKYTLYILDNIPLSDIWFANILFYSVSYMFFLFLHYSMMHANFNLFIIFSWLPHCVAYGILVPKPGIKPMPLLLEPQSLNTRLPGKSL